MKKPILIVAGFALATNLFAWSANDGGCKSVHSCWCDWYQRKWGDVPHDSFKPLEQAQLDAISDRYIEECRQKVAAAESKSEAHCDLGDAYLFRERWAEAESSYRRALELEPRKVYNHAKYLYKLAESLYGAKKKDAALATLKDLEALAINTQLRRQVDWSNYGRMARHFLDGSALDYRGMPLETGFKPFPEPQKAQYTEKFAPCRQIAIKLTGVDKDDARIRLLTRKLTPRGIESAFARAGSYVLDIALDPAAPNVDRPEGYTLVSRMGGAQICARDLQGILWGVVSFLQILDPKAKAARVCTVADWPDCPRRGYLTTQLWAGCTEFTVFNKMNCVVPQRHPMMNGEWSPLNVCQCESAAKEFRELGLDLRYGILSWTMDMNWPYCWKSYLGMQIEVCRQFAAMGAGVYYPNDDCRYQTLRPEDTIGGRKPSDFDAQHLLDLYTAVKSDCPDFRMVYCPPFYWGPVARHPYPDDREAYLKSMRILPPEVDIIWTGERVKSHKKVKPWVDWVTNLIGRKPNVFQNATGPHHLMSYAVDRTDWNGWHYPGFFENDIASYLKNAHMPEECPQTTSLADCLWNVKAYDPERGIRRGLNQYAGAGVFEALDSALEALTYFNRYKYGAVNTAVLHENVEKIDARMKLIRAATEKATALTDPLFMREGCGAWMKAVDWATKVEKAVHQPPDFKKQYAKLLEKTRAKARESGYDPAKGDILLDAIDFFRAESTPYPVRGVPEFITCAPWDDSRCSTTFKLAKKPKNDLDLVVYAIHTGTRGPRPDHKVALKVNGQVVHDGISPFRGKFNTLAVKVPKALLKTGQNELDIVNGFDNFRLFVVYALLKNASE